MRRGRLTLVLGGQKSGKSSYAARRAAAAGTVVVVTPAVVRDPEMQERVDRHRADRPAGWRTVETFDLPAALRQAPDGAAVVVDALDTWLAEVLLDLGVDLGDDGPPRSLRDRAEAEVVARIRAAGDAAHARAGETFVIAGQPGLGVHAAGRGARAYVDLHGIAVQTLSAMADEAVLVVAGRPLTLAAPPDIQSDLDTQGDPDWPGLREHGDTQVPPGAVDLAVNVLPGPPDWLAADLSAAAADLAAYPDDRPARAAAAARHGRPVGECLVVAGAAEAFWLLPHALRPRLAACIHPGFTEPEAALRAAQVPVVRVMRDPAAGWAFDPAAVPADADLVVLGRPDNPTGVVDPAERIAALCRPGRTVVVDEAFAEFLPDAGELASRRELPGLVVVRSLTKLWGLAGLRVGYVVAPAPVIAALAAGRQPWGTSTLALRAVERLVVAEDERARRAEEIAGHRAHLVSRLRGLAGVTAWDGAANFVLARTHHPDLRDALLSRGIAVRRGDTFPGLDRHHVRIAVRDPQISDRLAVAITAALEDLDAD